MGRTNTKKIEARNARLKALPQSERLLKSALIKKKESRVLDSSEKHALKMSSDHGEMLRLWEELRTLTDGKEEVASKKNAYEHKYPIVDKLIRLIEPKNSTVIKTPVGSRVLQSMIKYGSAEQLSKIMKWVSKDFSCYASDAYAHFVVMSIVRHAPHDVFKTLLASLIPNVSHLISHKFGIVTLHAAYSSKWCGKLDCQLLLLSVLKENVSVMKRWEGYPVLEDVLQKNPTLQKRLLPRLFDLCDKLVSQKEAIQFPFVQKLVYAYVKCGTREEVSELCETLRPYLASISTTREGAPLASLAFSLTEPKRRKEILQNFKDNLGEISTNKYGAPVIARLFDLLYDAQMLQKYVVADMTAHIGQVFSSPYGYLILMHLLTPHKERKDKFLLQNWHEHNLFSVENKEWNHHTWLTADYQTEVIEICSKPAQASHLLCLPAVVKSVIQYLKTTENKEKINRHQAFLVCREILHVEETEPMYRAAFSLTEADREVLRGFVGTKAAAEEEASTKKSPRKVEKKEKTTKKRARPADESAPKKDKSTKKVKKSQ